MQNSFLQLFKSKGLNGIGKRPLTQNNDHPNFDNPLYKAVFNIRDFDYSYVSVDKAHIDAFYKTFICTLLTYNIPEKYFNYIRLKADIDCSTGSVGTLNQIMNQWSNTEKLHIEMPLRALDFIFKMCEIKSEYVTQKNEIETLILSTLKPLIDYANKGYE